MKLMLDNPHFQALTLLCLVCTLTGPSCAASTTGVNREWQTTICLLQRTVIESSFAGIAILEQRCDELRAYKSEGEWSNGMFPQTDLFLVREVTSDQLRASFDALLACESFQACLQHGDCRAPRYYDYAELRIMTSGRTDVFTVPVTEVEVCAPGSNAVLEFLL